MKFSRDITVDQMMTEWPGTIDVLLRYRMLCIGCPISGFHTLVDAAREHHAELVQFEESLIEAIEKHSSGRAVL